MLVSSAAAQDGLVPHQAVYRMTLAPGSRAIDIASADGVMVYRAARECGGWTVENHTVIRYAQADGEDFEDRWAFVSWESDDGLTYRFRVRHQTDDEVDRIEGTAGLKTSAGGGLARFTAPEETEVDLPPGTLFPTEHLLRLIAAAKDGRTSFARVVFDGTTEDNPYFVNVMMAPLHDHAPSALAQAAGAPPVPTYWTRGAFFPYYSDSELPEFEMTIVLRADGIAESMEQVFQDLALRGTLLNVQLLPQPDC